MLKYITVAIIMFFGTWTMNAQIKFENVKREAPDLALIKNRLMTAHRLTIIPDLWMSISATTR